MHKHALSSTSLKWKTITKGRTKQGSTAIQRCPGTLSIGELNKCYALRMVVVPQEPDLGYWACSTMSATILESNLAVRA